MISQSSTTLNDEERRAGWPLHLRLFAHQLFRIVRSAISAITGTRISAGESETEQHLLTEEEVAHSRLLRSLPDSPGRNRATEQPGNGLEEEEYCAGGAHIDAWVYCLKKAYDAGYYRTEPAVDEQTPFPWQNKFCRDCPFWSD